MNNTTLYSPSKTAPWGGFDALRELVAAMPIVIIANAVREALQRPIGDCASAPVAESS